MSQSYDGGVLDNLTDREIGTEKTGEPGDQPPPEAIIDALERVRSSGDFAHSDRLRTFITYIVNETLAGRSDSLKEYVIGVDVFERGDDFDPQSSSIVRVEAGRLRQRLEHYNSLDGRDDPVHISLPAGGYVPKFESNQTRVDSNIPDRPPASDRKKITRILAAVCGIIVIGVIALRVIPSLAPVQPADPPSAATPAEKLDAVAVLPLRNLSGDIDQDYFSDGITDALITSLAKRLPLRVISTRSILAYKDVDTSVASIAKELSVNHVLEGAVMRIEDRVRITAQLIDTANDRHLWAETFEREVTDVLSLQSDIVHRIVASLVSEVAANDKDASKPTPILTQAAFEAQLKGRFFRNKMTEDGLKKGLRFFQEAVEIDPDYGLAYSGMAACYCLLGGHGFELIKPSEALPAAKEAALAAMSLNNSLAEPHAFLGIIRLKYEWDWKSAEAEFRTSIALNPSYSQARLFYSFYLEAMGRKEEAIREAEEARLIDPLSLEANVNLGWQYLQAGQLEKAKHQFEKTAELNPDSWGVKWGLGHYHRRKGDLDAAINAFEAAIDTGGGHALPFSGLGYTYGISGNPDKAREMIAELDRLSQRSYVSPVNVATVYAGLNDDDQVFKWLEKAFTDRSRSLAWLNVLPEFDAMRSDERFKSLIRRIGLRE